MLTSSYWKYDPLRLRSRIFSRSSRFCCERRSFRDIGATLRTLVSSGVGYPVERGA